jgi:hypothetical protein
VVTSLWADNAEVKQADYLRGLIKKQWEKLMKDPVYSKQIAPRLKSNK